jgi:hypothetical protein
VDAWTIFGITAAAIAIALSWVREHKRNAALRVMAVRRGFAFLGPALPRSLRLRGTNLEGATSVWNVVEGDKDGIRVVAFDCLIGSGKGRWRRTVIAAQGPRDVFAVAKLYGDFTLDHSGDWTIMFEPKAVFFGPGLMPISEVEAFFDLIGPLIATQCCRRS